MRSKVVRISAIAIAVFFLLSCMLAAGAAGPQKDKPKLQKSDQASPGAQESQNKDDQPFRIGTDLVLLDVTVVDPNNKTRSVPILKGWSSLFWDSCAPGEAW